MLPQKDAEARLFLVKYVQDWHVKNELAKLFERLETEGASVMPEVYALTSPHVFGIVASIVPDKACAERVLKSVYSRIWVQRNVLQTRHRGDPLTYLRRLAHRLAMDYKFQMNTRTCMETGVLIDSEADPAVANVLGVSEQDMRILRLAYLKGASVSDISELEKLEADVIKASLERTMKQLRGAAS